MAAAPAAIRPARTGEAPAVRRLIDAAYRPHVALLGKLPGPMLDDHERRIDEGQTWVLEDSGGIAGVLVLEDVDGALLLHNVAVAPEAQGQGHGRALIAFAEREALRRGHGAVRLYTNVLMTGNIALYRRLGFVETHRAMDGGYRRVFMTRALAQAGGALGAEAPRAP